MGWPQIEPVMSPSAVKAAPAGAADLAATSASACFQTIETKLAPTMKA
jgi:hypothetical protein